MTQHNRARRFFAFDVLQKIFNLVPTLPRHFQHWKSRSLIDGSIISINNDTHLCRENPMQWKGPLLTLLR